MKRIVVLLTFLCVKWLQAQDTLPAFKVLYLGGNKAQISWQNQYPNCTQLSIQKSFDSLKFFQTIFTSQSPELPQNGYVDNNYLPQIKTWYRIFYVVDTVTFHFTKSQIPLKTPQIITNFSVPNASIIKNNKVNLKTKIKLRDSVTDSMSGFKKLDEVIKNNAYTIFYNTKDSLWKVLDLPIYKKFKDSLQTKSKDTLFHLTNNNYLFKPFIPKPIWKPSVFIFSNSNKSITINNPKFKTTQYKVLFFDDKGKEIFALKNIKQEQLFIEKSNFIKAGWYNFELYENEKLKEKNKFLVEKDF